MTPTIGTITRVTIIVGTTVPTGEPIGDGITIGATRITPIGDGILTGATVTTTPIGITHTPTAIRITIITTGTLMVEAITAAAAVSATMLPPCVTAMARLDQ